MGDMNNCVVTCTNREQWCLAFVHTEYSFWEVEGWSELVIKTKDGESEHPSPVFILTFHPVIPTFHWTFQSSVSIPVDTLLVHPSHSQTFLSGFMQISYPMGFPTPCLSLFLAILLLQVLLEVAKLICEQSEPNFHDYPRIIPTALKEKSFSNVAFACVVLVLGFFFPKNIIFLPSACCC